MANLGGKLGTAKLTAEGRSIEKALELSRRVVARALPEGLEGLDEETTDAVIAKPGTTVAWVLSSSRLLQSPRWELRVESARL